MRRAAWSLALGLLVLIVQCAPAQPRSGSAPAESQAPTGVKRIVAAIRGNPPSISTMLNAGGGGRIDGGTELGALTSSGFATQKPTGEWIPVLVDGCPRSTTASGCWPGRNHGDHLDHWTGAAWHDGAPFTAHDVEFSITALSDSSMPWLVEPCTATSRGAGGRSPHREDRLEGSLHSGRSVPDESSSACPPPRGTLRVRQGVHLWALLLDQ